MKNLILTTVLALSFLLTVACAPNPAQIKKVIEENPDILFSAIEKNPEQFLETVNKAARMAREQKEQKMVEEESKKREAEFANPKKPEIQADRAIKGNKDAPITIVEYSDFQCPFCRKGSDTVNQIMEEYGDKVRLVFKHFPIDQIHPRARLASKYMIAISKQSAEKAYEFKNMTFAGQRDLQVGSDDEAAAVMDRWVKKIGGINMSKLKADLKKDSVEELIQADKQEANKFGFTGTPGYLINGVSLKGAYPLSEFKKIIDRHLAKK